MLENEIWGEIKKKEFDDHMSKLSEMFGEPKVKHRLGLEINDYNNTVLDTRIRITNGKPVIIQKVGKWDGNGAWEREEFELELPKDAKYIYDLYEILSNIVTSDNKQTNTFQNENFIFLTDEYEIKLTHQFGKSDVYTYEIEALRESIDVIEVCKEFGFTVDTSGKDEHYWKAFNLRVNTKREEYSAEEFSELIDKYLKY